MKTIPAFRPVPTALIDRIRSHLEALAVASSTDAQIAALFLAHCEMKDAEAMLPASTAEEA